MFTVTDRLYRTASGRLVRENDPEAAFLAYTAGTEVPDEEAKRSGLKEFYAAAKAAPAASEGKAAPRAEDKAAPRAEDKATSAPSRRARTDTGGGSK